MEASVISQLRKFLNQAGAEGLVLDGVDGGDLFMSVFNFEDKISAAFAKEVGQNKADF